MPDQLSLIADACSQAVKAKNSKDFAAALLAYHHAAVRPTSPLYSPHYHLSFYKYSYRGAVEKHAQLLTLIADIKREKALNTHKAIANKKELQVNPKESGLEEFMKALGEFQKTAEGFDCSEDCIQNVRVSVESLNPQDGKYQTFLNDFGKLLSKKTELNGLNRELNEEPLANIISDLKKLQASAAELSSANQKDGKPAEEATLKALQEKYSEREDVAIMANLHVIASKGCKIPEHATKELDVVVFQVDPSNPCKILEVLEIAEAKNSVVEIPHNLNKKELLLDFLKNDCEVVTLKTPKNAHPLKSFSMAKGACDATPVNFYVPSFESEVSLFELPASQKEQILRELFSILVKNNLTEEEILASIVEQLESKKLWTLANEMVDANLELPSKLFFLRAGAYEETDEYDPGSFAPRPVDAAAYQSFLERCNRPPLTEEQEAALLEQVLKPGFFESDLESGAGKPASRAAHRARLSGGGGRKYSETERDLAKSAESAAAPAR